MEINKLLTAELIEIFKSHFPTEPALVFSPGRINLLGEHIDYNDGYVLPAAIQLGIYGCFAPSGNNQVEIFAKDFNSWLRVDVADIGPSNGWQNYVLSVLNQFKLKGVEIPGFRMVMGSDLPIGSGLSSSAALEGAISFVVNHLLGNPFTSKELALIGQAAEHDYPGVKCGIMDQFANMLGKEAHIVRIDCMSQDTDYLPLQLNEYKLVLLYSNVQHALTGGEYNERRSQCREGLSTLKELTGHSSFRNISHAEIISAEPHLDPTVFMRCKYVVEEIERTRLAATYMQDGEWERLGLLMYETHWGLSHLYEVSLPELDWLVNFAYSYPGVAGARLMGGGFGGCTLNLVEKNKAEAFIEEALVGYKEKWSLTAQAYAVSAEDGTRIIS